jgi:hypothetical protein
MWAIWQSLRSYGKYVNTAQPTSILSNFKAEHWPQAKVRKTVDALQTLAKDGPLFATVMLHTFNFTVTDGDLIRTHRLRGLNMGDVLRFDKVRCLGSRHFELRGRPFIDPAFHDIRAVVVEAEGHGQREPVPRKRQRKGLHRHQYTDPRVTVLCVHFVRAIVPPELPPRPTTCVESVLARDGMH